jgi:hypothetical protein
MARADPRADAPALVSLGVRLTQLDRDRGLVKREIRPAIDVRARLSRSGARAANARLPSAATVIEVGVGQRMPPKATPSPFPSVPSSSHRCRVTLPSARTIVSAAP